MQFTPQQLAGYKGYSTGVKIGNWFEDHELRQTKIEAFLLQKRQGNLSSSLADEKISFALKPVHLTPLHEDGGLCFGDLVMVYNAQTEGVLATDLDDKQKSEEELYAITTTPNLAPSGRTVFRIDRVDGEASTDRLLFGQRFRLANAQLRADPLYLHSQPTSVTSYAKFSRKQEVSLAVNASWSCTWEVLSVDPNIRFELEGTPVPANAAVVINHVQTNSHLGSDKLKYWNDFGTEFETHCHTYSDMMRATVGNRSKHPPSEHNHWIFITAPPSNEGAAIAPAKPREVETNSISEVLVELQDKIGDQWSSVHDAFRFADVNHDNKISRQELETILGKFHLHLTTQQIDTLFAHYDADGSGRMDYNEFLKAFGTSIAPSDSGGGLSNNLVQSGGGKDFTTDVSQFKF